MKFLPLLSLPLAFVGATSVVVAQEIASPGAGSPERTADVQVVGHIDKPAELAEPDISLLHVPDGFRIEKFARNLGNARILAVSPAGLVYFSRREQGDILMLNVGADGLAAGKPIQVAARSGMHGITFHGDKVYLATVHEIFSAKVLPDGLFGPPEMLVDDLPDAGQHHTRTVQFGPDGMMYVSIGSTCNECDEPNQENASILQISPDGKHRKIFASGLRDTIGWGWQPANGELWGMDHGIDWLGDDLQPEELNHIQEGRHYGWPYIFADNKINPHLDPPAGIEKSELAKVSTPMVMGYTAHAAPMQLSFYSANQFPGEYRGDAFISMRGSWNRKPPSGYEVLRIRFKDGKPTGFEPFVTGFLVPEGQYGRLCGNAVAKDGSLLFTDDRNGVIYRVSYIGPAAPPSGVIGVAVRDSSPHAAAQTVGPLAIEAPATKTEGKLAVTSAAFDEGKTIPLIYSAYDQNASLPVKWTTGPEGTKTYAVLFDDPDASTQPVPASHWVAWNIPGDVTSLHEGLMASQRLKDPDGLCQGANYVGKIGYSGPKPPAADPAHHYHLQVFALDANLELPIGSVRADVLAAMKGHVVASGQLIGMFQRPEHPEKP